MTSQSVTCGRCGVTIACDQPGIWACPACGWKFQIPTTTALQAVQHLQVPQPEPQRDFAISVDVSHRHRRQSHEHSFHGKTILYLVLGAAFLMLMSYGIYRFEFNRVGNKAATVAKIIAFEDAARTQMGLLKSALQQYNLDVGSYPTRRQGLTALIAPPGDLRNPAKWRGPYLENEIPRDPWGNDFLYEWNGIEFTITSAGANGKFEKEGGDDITLLGQ